MLRAEGLSKAYGTRQALHDVSFTAAPGELLAVTGPNGAGKTTLLQIVAGGLAPTAGRVSVAGGAVGWVPQEPAVYAKLSVRENLRLFARLERVADVPAAVERMLDQTDLRDRAGDPVGTLSGGNRQRVVLWEFVAELAQAGTTVLFTTHHVGEAHRYADRLVVLDRGRIVFTGTEAELRATAGAGADDFESAFVALLARAAA